RLSRARGVARPSIHGGEIERDLGEATSDRAAVSELETHVHRVIATDHALELLRLVEAGPHASRVHAVDAHDVVDVANASLLGREHVQRPVTPGNVEVP